MKLISWNVQKATGKRVERQIENIKGRKPDIVSLQEVVPGSVNVYRKGLREAGFGSFRYSLNEGSSGVPSTKRSKSGVVIASRWKLRALPSKMKGKSWEHKFLSTQVTLKNGKSIEVHTAHIPPGVQYGKRKIKTLRDIYAVLAKRSSIPRILCGDFNTPREELKNGTVITWGQRKTKDGRIIVRPGRGEEWIIAEWDILKGLAIWDLRDVYRWLYGYYRQEFSWVLKRKEKRIQRRYDHVFASNALKPTRCIYLHSWRENKLSDHSPIEVIFAFGKG